LITILMVSRVSQSLQADFAKQLNSIGTTFPKYATSPRAERSHSSGPLRTDSPQVNQAIESIRERVRATAEEQTREIESLRLELNSNPDTGVANRRYFINALRQTLHGPIESESGIPLAY